MLTVTEGYAAAMIPAITVFRETRPRVTVSAMTEPVSATVTQATDADTHARSDQVINGVFNTRYRFGSAELNCWKLDGSTVLQPDIAQDAEVGYVSDGVSASDKTFTVNPVLVVVPTTATTVKGLSIAFDLLDNEYATDFTLYIEYGTALTTTITVTGNTSAIYNTLLGYANVTYIRLTITKWSAVGRKAKMSEIGFGLVQQFGSEFGEPLLYVNSVDEVDLTTKTMPHGELTFEFYDTNNDFSVLTPTARTKVFTEGTKISAEIGVRQPDGSLEYVRAGTYHFSAWTAPKSKVVRVQAVDLIGLASDKTPKEQYGGRSKISAFNAVVSFMAAAGFNYPTNAEIATALFPNTGTDFLDWPYANNVAEELMRLAQWSMSIPYVDTTGVLRFKTISQTPLKVINYANIFENPRMVRYEQILGVRVYYYDCAVSSDITEIASASGVFGAGTALVLDIGYEYEFYDVVAFGGATIVSSTGFAYGKYSVTVSGTGGVTVRGKAWVIGKQFIAAPNTTVTNPKALWVEVDNPHICTLARATNVANWMLGIYARIAEVDFDWRGTPEIETMDTIDLEPQSGTRVNTIVLKNEWQHDGALKYMTRGAAMWLQ